MKILFKFFLNLKKIENKLILRFIVFCRPQKMSTHFVNKNSGSYLKVNPLTVIEAQLSFS